jgi:glycosyltransferase involved in cell wall biosynthesis
VRAAIFVLSGSTAGQQGPVAALVSTAGWAAAAARVLGEAWIATPAEVLDPEAARRAGSGRHLTSTTARTWPRLVPVTAKTAARDVLQWNRGRGAAIEPAGPWAGRDVSFVWQRHEMFHSAGLDLADRLGVPSVLFVTAPQVWEAEQWGVRRPGWGRWLERVGEQPALRRADLVACGTNEIARQVGKLGVPADRMLITPTGVDLDLFAPEVRGDDVRHELGLDDSFVVGWVGSFRRFHALENAVDAVARLDGATLLLVGDGPERPRLEHLAAERGTRVVFTGTVPHPELPQHLAAMDAALVVASAERSFHYSPLKLAEYLASGLPVVAPRSGQLVDRLHDGTDALLVEPGDPDALAGALRRLQADPGLRRHLAAGARRAAEASWSWDLQIRRVGDALG